MSRTRTAMFAATLILVATPPAHGQLDPNAFGSLGTLNVSSGTLTINTDTLSMSGAASFTGVSFNQNAGPQVAVFDFSSITIGSGVTVTLTGSRRALALLSQGNATIQPTLTVSTFAGNNIPALGGYAGGYVLVTTDGSNEVFLAQNGGGPGGGGADFLGAGGGGHGGYGGFGGSGSGGLPGLAYGNLFQTLQGGSGGGAAIAAVNGASPKAQAGAGGGALEVVAAGSLSVAGVTAGGSSTTALSGTTGTATASAGGGAGGGILLRGGTGLTLNGTLDAHGGDAEAAGGSAGGGGGGRIALSGLSSYTLGANPFAFNLNGSNGAGGGTAGFAGVLTVDALSTTIPNGTSVTLNGASFISVAGSTTQTGATIEAYARHGVIVNGTAVLAVANACQNVTVSGTATLGATSACQNLVVNVNGTGILGATNGFQMLDASGNNITSLTLDGTLDLNGFSQTVDTFSEPSGHTGLVKLPAGSTFSVGVNGATGVFYLGQLSGPGSFVKAGSGTQNLTAASPNFTGQTTVTGGSLQVGDGTLQNSSVMLAGGGLAFLFGGNNPVFGSLAGTGTISLAGLSFTSLTVGGNNASTTYAGNFFGPASGGVIVNKAGTGVWTLTGTNTQIGQFNVQAGTVLIGSAGALAPSNSVSVSAGATLDLNGYDYTFTSGNSLTVQGNVRLGQAGLTVASGATATYNGGTISGGFLGGAGTVAVTGGAILSGVTTFASTPVSVTGPASFVNFTNGGPLTVAAGLASPVVFTRFTNQGSGTITIGAVSSVNASDFQTYGTLTINPAMLTQNFSQTTLLTNTGTSQLYFNGGSRTFVGTPATAVFPSNWPNMSQRGLPTFVAGIDLHGQNAVVAGGLFVDNGYVEDTTNNNQGTAAIVADFGSLVKGAGYFQNSVQTINGGKFQAGNSPGKATFGSFVLGPGGVSNYVFAIDDATGAAGPSPDAAGHVSGWGLVRVSALPATHGGLSAQGDFTWTATPADKLTVSLETLVNPTTVGTDVQGLMDHFDSTRPYVWPAVEWAGSYAGPADAAVLDAATAFDATGFANAMAGTLGWQLDAAGHTLSLTYTPSAVPEPGTLALLGMAAVGGVMRGAARYRSRAAGR